MLQAKNGVQTGGGTMLRGVNRVQRLLPHLASSQMTVAASSLDCSCNRVLVIQAAAVKEGTSLSNNPAFKK